MVSWWVVAALWLSLIGLFILARGLLNRGQVNPKWFLAAMTAALTSVVCSCVALSFHEAQLVKEASSVAACTNFAMAYVAFHCYKKRKKMLEQ